MCCDSANLGRDSANFGDYSANFWIYSANSGRDSANSGRDSAISDYFRRLSDLFRQPEMGFRQLRLIPTLKIPLGITAKNDPQQQKPGSRPGFNCLILDFKVSNG